MSMLTRGRSRLAALGTAGALAASFVAGSGVVLAPAGAAEPTAPPALAWSISEQFVSHLSTRTFAGGAAFDADRGLFTFPGRSTSVTGGTTTYAYEGSVRGAFAIAATEYYSVTIADPEVSIDAAGDGEITAVVSATNAAAMGNPAASTAPARVTVAELADAERDVDGVRAGTDWVGVLPPGSPEAVELGITTEENPDNPVDGQAFHPDFLRQVTAGVRAHFYASGSGSDPKKPVGGVVAEAVPTVTASVLAASATDGIDVRIDAAGFDPATNPGDAGVYVGVAAADAVIDFDDREAGAAAFVAVDWVTPARFTDGRFTSTLNLPTDKLVEGTSYAVYTWQAHTHSNTTQDTVTPFAVDWAKVFPKAEPVPAPEPGKVAPRLKVKVLKAPTTRKAGKARVVARGSQAAVTGTVKAELVKGKKRVKRLGATKLGKGKAVVRLPKRARGAYKLKVTYRGSSSYEAATKAVRFRVRRG